MLVRSLVSRGFACCEAEDGLEALSEMLRSSNHTIRKFPGPILPVCGPISEEGSMAGGGPGSPQSPQSPPSSYSPDSPVRAVGGRKILNGVACTNMLLSSQTQHFSIDAILIDFHMPKMNGPEAIVELRNMGKTMSTNPINPPYQPTLSTHFINIPYQYTLLTHPINQIYQHTLSTHLINPPHQLSLSTHLINTLYQHRIPGSHHRRKWW